MARAIFYTHQTSGKLLACARAIARIKWGRLHCPFWITPWNTILCQKLSPRKLFQEKCPNRRSFLFKKLTWKAMPQKLSLFPR